MERLQKGQKTVNKVALEITKYSLGSKSELGKPGKIWSVALEKVGHGRYRHKTEDEIDLQRWYEAIDFMNEEWEMLYWVNTS